MTNSGGRFWRRRGGLLLRILWIGGFSVGICSHAADLLVGGLQVYSGYPTPLRVFWVSLLLLDLLVAVAIGARKVAGIMLGAAVILTDIAVNWTVYLTVETSPLYGVVDQSIFAVFVIITAVPLWRSFSRIARTPLKLPD